MYGESLLSNGWALIFGTLIGITLLLYIAVWVTNVDDEKVKSSINQAGVNALLRMSVFISVYIMLIALHVAILWLGIKISLIFKEHSGWGQSFLGTYIFWIIFIFLTVYLFAPLFNFFFSKEKWANRKEIQRNEAPELFSLIEETAKQVGVSVPKRVFISPYVNACVFYDAPWKSLFFSAQKNLEIGIGLMQGTNQSELKAVIAHEFGHFAQQSMRVNLIVVTGYRLIGDLVVISKWSKRNWDPLSFIIAMISALMRKMYLFVLKGSQELSRQMEYDADNVSVNIAGSTACISAICKTEVISDRFEVYNAILSEIANTKQILPSSYWNGYDQFLKFTSSFDGKVVSPDVMINEIDTNRQDSKVQIKDPWISHPSLQQRITNFKKNGQATTKVNKTSALLLLSSELRNQISDLLFERGGYTSCKRVDDAEYATLLLTELNKHTFTLELRPFFNRAICSFDPHEVQVKEVPENPFTEHNTKIMQEFSQAITDYQLMLQFRDKQIEEKIIRYEGHVYGRKDVPIKTQEIYLQGLHRQVADIDIAVYQYALSMVDNKGLILQAYDNIFYAQSIIEKIQDSLFEERNALYEKLGVIRVLRRDEVANFRKLQQYLIDFKNAIRHTISILEMDRVRPVASKESWKRLSDFMEKDVFFTGGSIYPDDICCVFSIPDILAQLFENLAYLSKKIITDCILGREPLMAWEETLPKESDLPQWVVSHQNTKQ